MSAEGELIINEYLKDIVEDKINEKLKGIKWSLDASDYCGAYDVRTMEGCHRIRIIDDNTDKILGFIEVKINLFLNRDTYEPFIDAEIDESSIKIDML